MTTTFRKKLRNGVLLAILALGLIAIVITGFGTGGSGIGGIGGGGQQAQRILAVGDEELTDSEFSRRMSMIYLQAQRQQPTLDRGQFFARNFNEALEGTIDELALVAFARQNGLVVSPTMVDRIIAAQFQNVAGQYDPAEFQRFLTQERRSEREVREEIEAGLAMRMLLAPIAGSPRVPQAVAREYTLLQLETRTGQFNAIPTALVARGMQPSDQEVAAFYQQNQRLFALPERRALRFALIGRDQLGDAVRASDQEVAAYYQQNQGQYGPGETRSLQIFTTQDEGAARRLAERVRGGTNFIEAARAEGFSAEDVTFPNLRREQAAQQTSVEVANAAFGAAQGGLVGPTRTPTGIKVVRVDAVTRTPGRPLETVRAEIVTAIEQRKLAEQINARLEQIEEQLDGGASFEDVARQAGLQVQTSPPMTAAGTAPNFQFPQQLAPLVTAAFELDPDGDPEIQVVQPDQLVALVQVANVLPPAAPPFDQVRDQVRERLIQQTALQRARVLAEGIVTRINGGMAPAEAYRQAGLSLPAPETRTIPRYQLSRVGQAAPPPLRMLFAIPEGRARMIPAPDGTGWIIVHHQRRVPGNPAVDPSAGQIASALEQQLLQASDGELQAQFARAVRSTLEIERNEEAITALRGRMVTGN